MTTIASSMVNVSVRLMVSCFCLALVATPGIIVSLLSDATESAMGIIFEPFFTSAAVAIADKFAERANIAYAASLEVADIAADIPSALTYSVRSKVRDVNLTASETLEAFNATVLTDDELIPAGDSNVNRRPLLRRQSVIDDAMVDNEDAALELLCGAVNASMWQQLASLLWKTSLVRQQRLVADMEAVVKSQQGNAADSVVVDGLSLDRSSTAIALLNRDLTRLQHGDALLGASLASATAGMLHLLERPSHPPASDSGDDDDDEQNATTSPSSVDGSILQAVLGGDYILPQRNATSFAIDAAGDPSLSPPPAHFWSAPVGASFASGMAWEALAGQAAATSTSSSPSSSTTSAAAFPPTFRNRFWPSLTQFQQRAPSLTRQHMTSEDEAELDRLWAKVIFGDDAKRPRGTSSPADAPLLDALRGAQLSDTLRGPSVVSATMGASSSSSTTPVAGVAVPSASMRLSFLSLVPLSRNLRSTRRDDDEETSANGATSAAAAASRQRRSRSLVTSSSQSLPSNSTSPSTSATRSVTSARSKVVTALELDAPRVTFLCRDWAARQLEMVPHALTDRKVLFNPYTATSGFGTRKVAASSASSSNTLASLIGSTTTQLTGQQQQKLLTTNYAVAQSGVRLLSALRDTADDVVSLTYRLVRPSVVSVNGYYPQDAQVASPPTTTGRTGVEGPVDGSLGSQQAPASLFSGLTGSPPSADRVPSAIPFTRLKKSARAVLLEGGGGSANAGSGLSLASLSQLAENARRSGTKDGSRLVWSPWLTAFFQSSGVAEDVLSQHSSAANVSLRCDANHATGESTTLQFAAIIDDSFLPSNVRLARLQEQEAQSVRERQEERRALLAALSKPASPASAAASSSSSSVPRLLPPVPGSQSWLPPFRVEWFSNPKVDAELEDPGNDWWRTLTGPLPNADGTMPGTIPSALARAVAAQPTPASTGSSRAPSDFGVSPPTVRPSAGVASTPAPTAPPIKGVSLTESTQRKLRRVFAAASSALNLGAVVWRYRKTMNTDVEMELAAETEFSTGSSSASSPDASVSTETIRREQNLSLLLNQLVWPPPWAARLPSPAELVFTTRTNVTATTSTSTTPPRVPIPAVDGHGPTAYVEMLPCVNVTRTRQVSGAGNVITTAVAQIMLLNLTAFPRRASLPGDAAADAVDALRSRSTLVLPSITGFDADHTDVTTFPPPAAVVFNASAAAWGVRFVYWSHPTEDALAAGARVSPLRNLTILELNISKLALVVDDEATLAGYLKNPGRGGASFEPAAASVGGGSQNFVALTGTDPATRDALLMANASALFKLLTAQQLMVSRLSSPPPRGTFSNSPPTSATNDVSVHRLRRSIAVQVLPNSTSTVERPAPPLDTLLTCDFAVRLADDGRLFQSPVPSSLLSAAAASGAASSSQRLGQYNATLVIAPWTPANVSALGELAQLGTSITFDGGWPVTEAPTWDEATDGAAARSQFASSASVGTTSSSSATSSTTAADAASSARIASAGDSGDALRDLVDGLPEKTIVAPLLWPQLLSLSSDGVIVCSESADSLFSPAGATVIASATSAAAVIGAGQTAAMADLQRRVSLNDMAVSFIQGKPNSNLNAAATATTVGPPLYNPAPGVRFPDVLAAEAISAGTSLSPLAPSLDMLPIASLSAAPLLHLGSAFTASRLSSVAAASATGAVPHLDWDKAVIDLPFLAAETPESPIWPPPAAQDATARHRLRQMSATMTPPVLGSQTQTKIRTIIGSPEFRDFGAAVPGLGSVLLDMQAELGRMYQRLHANFLARRARWASFIDVVFTSAAAATAAGLRDQTQAPISTDPNQLNVSALVNVVSGKVLNATNALLQIRLLSTAAACRTLPCQRGAAMYRGSPDVGNFFSSLNGVLPVAQRNGKGSTVNTSDVVSATAAEAATSSSSSSSWWDDAATMDAAVFVRQAASRTTISVGESPEASSSSSSTANLLSLVNRTVEGFVRKLFPSLDTLTSLRSDLDPNGQRWTQAFFAAPSPSVPLQPDDDDDSVVVFVSQSTPRLLAHRLLQRLQKWLQRTISEGFVEALLSDDSATTATDSAGATVRDARDASNRRSTYLDKRQSALLQLLAETISDKTAATTTSSSSSSSSTQFGRPLLASLETWLRSDQPAAVLFEQAARDDAGDDDGDADGDARTNNDQWPNVTSISNLAASDKVTLLIGWLTSDVFLDAVATSLSSVLTTLADVLLQADRLEATAAMPRRAVFSAARSQQIERNATGWLSGIIDRFVPRKNPRLSTSFFNVNGNMIGATDVYFLDLVRDMVGYDELSRGTPALVDDALFAGRFDSNSRPDGDAPAAVSARLVLRRVTVLVISPDPTNSSSTDIFVGNNAVSVIVGVSVTAFSVVFVLSLLHHVFNPLKVMGANLRKCADMNLSELEALTPSNITEIYLLQRMVNLLTKRMTQFSAYLPDRSQLIALLENEPELKSFGDQDVAVAPLKGNRVVGSIPHSITVHVEYRSRQKPTLQRQHDDLRKTCAFALVYSSGDPVFDMLMSQCLSRLNERVGEPLQLRLKPRMDGKRRIDIDDTILLKNTEDVLRAIELSQGSSTPGAASGVLGSSALDGGGSLQLLLVKCGRKNFFPWIQVLVSVTATFATGFLCATWLDETSLALRRCGAAAAFCVATKLFLNLLSAMYLLRRFVGLSPKFRDWLPTAMQETVFAVICSAFTVTSLNLMFSHTRLTSLLRFNAPSNYNIERLIVKYAIAGYLIGELVPLAIISFAGVAFRDTIRAPTTLAVVALGSASILLFVLQRVLQSWLSDFVSGGATNTENNAAAKGIKQQQGAAADIGEVDAKGVASNRRGLFDFSFLMQKWGKYMRNSPLPGTEASKTHVTAAGVLTEAWLQQHPSGSSKGALAEPTTPGANTRTDMWSQNAFSFDDEDASNPRGRQQQDRPTGGADSDAGSDNPEAGHELTDINDSRRSFAATAGEESTNAAQGGLSADATMNVAQRQHEEDSEHERGRYLSLSERDATVLVVSLSDSELHFSSMNSVEIQLFCERFLSFVFNEAKLYGALVSYVRKGVEVCLLFNCHRAIPSHALVAVKCLLAIHRNVSSNMSQWCTEDTSIPTVVGVVITGTKLPLGYVGAASGRRFQHIGPSAVLVEAMVRLAQAYKAPILTAGRLANIVEELNRTANANATNRTATHSSLTKRMLTLDAMSNIHAGLEHLSVRDIDVLQVTGDSYGLHPSLMQAVCEGLISDLAASPHVGATAVAAVSRLFGKSSTSAGATAGPQRSLAAGGDSSSPIAAADRSVAAALYRALGDMYTAATRASVQRGQHHLDIAQIQQRGITVAEICDLTALRDSSRGGQQLSSPSTFNASPRTQQQPSVFHPGRVMPLTAQERWIKSRSALSLFFATFNPEPVISAAKAQPDDHVLQCVAFYAYNNRPGRRTTNFGLQHYHDELYAFLANSAAASATASASGPSASRQGSIPPSEAESATTHRGALHRQAVQRATSAATAATQHSAFNQPQFSRLLGQDNFTVYFTDYS